jgi:S-adenosylmethionine uptake transporter
MTRAYATGVTLRIASLQYLAIVFGFIFGVWIFDDPVRLMSLAGMALIISAGVVANMLRARASAGNAAASDT